MAKLIDADELIRMYFDDEDGNKIIEFIPAEFVDNAPTVDAVPVVRCKDCKWRDVSEKCVAYEAFQELGDDGFCSCGERKDDPQTYTIKAGEV